MHIYQKILIVVCLLVVNVTWAKKQDDSKLKVISAKEVVKHKSKKSCWMVIDKYVYDVTSYLDKHPSPYNILFKCCGRDCTKGYADKNIGNPHSSGADKLLATMLIGILKEKM